ncbi:MAG TPA: DinB family protein [Candidatus Cybelea sp.]|nr:DinB family protein [Candidatus Cybelea sp.]
MPSETDLKAEMERVAVELLEGRGAHADPLASIEDLAVEQASRKPGGFEHSIFEIVAHLNYWMAYDLKRIRGARDPYPAHAAESWPSAGPIGEVRWEGEVRRFRELLGEFRAACRSDSEGWVSEAPATHESHQRNASTVGALIFQAIAHNSYHLGQIVDLRRSLGRWPPSKGGDTW